MEKISRCQCVCRLAVFIVAGSMSMLIRPADAAEPLPVAIVNIDRVLKEYQPLQDQLAPLKEQARELEDTVRLRQAEAESVVAKLRNTQPGTLEYQQLQAEAGKLQNELRQFIATERESLQKKEAAVYIAFYRRMELAVGKYAKAHGIRLVLRQQGGELDENQPLAEVIKTLNRDVIWHEGLDITDDVLSALKNDKSGAER